MTEFKGTKGKWKLESMELARAGYVYYTSVRNLDDNAEVCASRVNNIIESNANMLLISKAPEMLEMLIELRKFGQNHGMPYDLYEDLDKLIREATEM